MAHFFNELLEHLLQSLFIETNDQLFSDAQDRCPQRSGSAQHHLRQFIIAGPVFLQVEVQQLLPLADVQLVYSAQECERFVAFVLRFASVDFLNGLDTVLRKKLLRLSAGRSARAVIAPVNLWHPSVSFWQ